MDIPEFTDSLKQIIRLGEERVNVEYKGRMSWNQGVTNTKILKAMMAMANNRDGGVIVIGVENSHFDPVGLEQNEFDSYDYDTVARFVNSHTQPVIDFVLNKGKITEDDGEEKLFVVIQVQETEEIPVVSTTQVLNNPSVGTHLRNIDIREGAVYIRSKSPVESRELTGHREWKDFVKLLLDRNQRRLIDMIPWSQVNEPELAEESDTNQFNNQLEDL
jgi:predicted HTH transcriptional regulator